ncbi:GntR family transcriptional regulator [Pedobacter sp. BS3]|uniref:substrate-binding domain-containing protein n=1 Tax=Pedobacter sp. BS3 TaxID=2567937 RepID=UPI0011F01905|nr:substrate-binding domain-containing protein [Pedobacter sp. BS3]TZF82738.1 GntR family transcriptional regulator [Pedobacter sp. BS3]
MESRSFFNQIIIDEGSIMPKYIQFANSILNGIEAGWIKKNDTLPSINELNCSCELSRDSINKGYQYLKNLGIIHSVSRKGYFISNVDFRQTLKICLLFNKLSNHKKVIYDSFVSTIGDYIPIDFYIYNNDFNFFNKIINKIERNYSHYVIIPHFYDGEELAHQLISAIPAEKLVLIDKIIPGIPGNYAAVYENFEKDIFHALEQAKQQLAKYHTLKLIFPLHGYFPKAIMRGFFHFCQEYAFTGTLVHDIKDEQVNSGEVFISLQEDDLVAILERIIASGLEIGKQVGVISYNETPLKSIILNGITTISTDFKLMGQTAARLIIDNSRQQVEVPFYLTLRPSL